MPEARLPRARVLIVDDSAPNLLALEAILAPLRVELVRAMSGNEALRRVLEPGEFALILMDVQMPDLDGFQTASIIKERGRSQDVPIIFITALGDGEHAHLGYSRGAVDYLSKPFDPEILRSKVSVFVDLFERGARIRAQAAQLAQQERERVERRGHERYLRLFESMPLAVIATDATGKPTQTNRAFDRLFPGFVFERLPLLDERVVHPDDLARAREHWDNCASGECGPFELEIRMRGATGGWRWYLARAVSEPGENGETSAWIATLVDIDRRRKAEDAAQAANRAKDEFLAIVSHELRTPLTAILGWTHLLRRRIVDAAKFDRAIDMLERNALAQAELINDILDVSRITTGKLRLERAPMDLGATVEAAVDTVRTAAQGRGVTLEIALDPKARAFVGDPERLRQVVWNLVSNAIKFSPAGSAVKTSLFLSPDGGDCVIEVSDHGEGIAPGFLPHVFERFRQEDSGTTRAHGGLGLGLSIVKHIVELHGGTVVARSAGHGKGATFAVRLPRTDLPETASVAAPPVEDSVLGARLANLDVLFVEDQENARESLGEIMRLAGARVRAVASVAEAMQSMSVRAPDVLVSDIGMPREDGLSLIRRIRLLPPERGGRVPAIAVSGFARDEDEQRSLAEGFQRHLRKPVQPQLLVDEIARIAHSEA